MVKTTKRARTMLLAGFALLVFVGCGQRPTAPGAASLEPGNHSGNQKLEQVAAEQQDEDSLPPQFRGTAGVIDKPAAAAGTPVLDQVQVTGTDYFDRVTFTFAGNALPGYHIEYIDQPVRQCGSGDVVPLAGQGWLLVRFSPARAHTEQGDSSVEPRALSPGLPLLKGMALTCDFEGQVAWVLGLASPNRYRAVELGSPTRLVIDIRR